MEQADSEHAKESVLDVDCGLLASQPISAPRELFSDSDDPVWQALKEKYKPKKKRQSFIWD